MLIVLVWLPSSNAIFRRMFHISLLNKFINIILTNDSHSKLGLFLLISRINSSTPNDSPLSKNVNSHTMIVFFLVGYFSQLTQSISDGSGAFDILMLFPLNRSELVTVKK